MNSSIIRSIKPIRYYKCWEEALMASFIKESIKKMDKPSPSKKLSMHTKILLTPKEPIVNLII